MGEGVPSPRYGRFFEISCFKGLFLHMINVIIRGRLCALAWTNQSPILPLFIALQSTAGGGGGAFPRSYASKYRREREPVYFILFVEDLHLKLFCIMNGGFEFQYLPLHKIN